MALSSTSLLLASVLAFQSAPPVSMDGPAAVTRVETFLIEAPTPEGPELVGLMSLRRREVAGGVLLEQDLCFKEGGVRVLMSERQHRTHRRFVWRELGAPDGGGRILVVEGEVGASRLRSLTWSGGPPLRRELRAPVPALASTQGTGRGHIFMPLGLLERLRKGEDGLGELDRLDPLTQSVERVHVLQSQRADSNSRTTDLTGTRPGRRTIRLLDARGEATARWVFEGERLTEWRWGSGRWAHPVERSRYDSLLREWMGEGPLAASEGGTPSQVVASR